MKRYKRCEDEHENTHLWLLTYSDVVTLCLTFFVLLYSFSTLDAHKWRSLVGSLQGALGVLDGGKSSIEDDFFESGSIDVQIPDVPQNEAEYRAYLEEQKKLQAIQEKFNQYIEDHKLQGSVTTNIEERGMVIRFQDSVLFPKSSAELHNESRIILTDLATIFLDLGCPIRIEGHTDNLPIHTARYPSNWELSTARATNVLRYLTAQGIAGKLLSAVGYGEFHPIAENTNEENRRKNRRVDIVLIRESLLINEPH